jgi:sulfur-carrier protein
MERLKSAVYSASLTHIHATQRKTDRLNTCISTFSLDALMLAVTHAKVHRMITVSFAPSIQRHKPVAEQRVSVGTLAQVLDAACGATSGLRHYILDDQGAIRKHVAVFVNQEMHLPRDELSRPLRSGDQVLVIQCLTGG